MPPLNFLDLPGQYTQPARAAVSLVPIPLEATVSYGGGTGKGPEAIIEASQQVELYDWEFDAEPALDFGIHTHPLLALSREPARAVDEIAEQVAQVAATGKLVVGLGGEHTVSVGMLRGLLRAMDRPVTVVQLDAHADLRDRYEGTPYSHACIARRLLEEPQVEQVLQLGIRSVCREEVAFARANAERVHIWYAEAIHAGEWREAFIRHIAGRHVYITIDVDGLDPSIVPATGTPEPDGLSWRQALDILRITAQSSAGVVGLDCVELAPVSYQHAADFAVAKLVYKAITYAMRFGR